MRLALRIFAAMLALVAVAGLGLYLWLRTSLPEVAGEVVAPGLTQPAQILRDRHGVPHITAASVPDAYFALGFAHAQDRLWQMEVNRRLAAGRLAEGVGSPALEFDRFMRTLGFRRVAEQQAAQLTGPVKAAFEAYAAGVNAFLATRRGVLPPEFVALQITPEPWTPADSLSWHKVMALSLSGNMFREIGRARLIEKLGPAQAEQFWPAYPPGGPVALAGLQPLLRDVARNVDLAALQTLFPDPDGLGSNNWVVSGARTATGKPLLANDPHLGLGAPSIWYFAHLAAPGMTVLGATFPGVPGVVIGRNDRVAWGFTNTGPDTQDLFIERVDPADPSRYLAPEGPRPFVARTETIRVRAADPVTMTVRETRHGPVVSDLARLAGVAKEGHVIALQWTALDPADRTHEALERLSRVRDWTGFVDAVRLYGTPQQNMVYADVDGNIGFIAPGRVPIRRADNELRGVVPSPGWDPKYDWQGFIPFDELPQSFNPPSGKIATANNQIVPDDYPHYITDEWEEPYRAQRIEDLLAAREVHTMASFQAMQADVLSLQARETLPLLLAAVQPKAETRTALELLRNWNGAAEAGRPEPLIYAAWLREFSRALYADELGESFRDQFRLNPLFLVNVLRRADHARWCDRVNTPAVEDCAAIVTQGLDAALADLRERHGGAMDRWRWGPAHRARFEHRPFGQIPVLNRLFNIEVETPGDGYTVNVGHYRPANDRRPFANVHAASLRLVFDLADLDRSVFMYAPGQSGNILSPHFDDLAKSWAAVEYLPLSARRSDSEPGAQGALILRPGER